jgi:hypothetical protein
MNVTSDEKSLELRRKLILAGEIAVEELILVAEHKINFIVTKPRGKESKNEDEEASDLSVAADKLKTAAQAKKLAIMDAFEILNKIQLEREVLISLEKKGEETSSKGGFAEQRARSDRS